MTEIPQITKTAMNSHASPGNDHHSSRSRCPSDAIRQDPSQNAAQRSSRDRDEGEQRRAPDNRNLLGAQSRIHVHEKPCPHCVQLPHVAEIADVGEQQAAIAENSASLARIKQGASEGIGPLVGEKEK